MNSIGVSGLQAMAGRLAWVRYAIVCLCMIVVAAVGYVFRLHGVQQAYRQGEARVRELEQSTADRQQQLKALAGAKKALAAVEAQLQEARWRLAAGSDMSELLDQLSVSGRAHGLSFQALDVGTQEAHVGYRRISLQIQVTGRYPALRAWLDDWLQQMRLLRVGSLHLAADPQHPGFLRLRMEVQAFHPGEVLAAPQSLADEPARRLSGVPRVDPFAPWVAHRNEATGLAGIPLEQLEMVGSLARGGQYHALVRWAGHVYRVGEGDRLGREEGEVVRIEETGIELRERLFIAGQWQERSGYLALNKGLGAGIRDEHEKMGTVPGNAADAATAARGSRL